MSASLWIDADRFGQLHASHEIVRAILGPSGEPERLVRQEATVRITCQEFRIIAVDELAHLDVMMRARRPRST